MEQSDVIDSLSTAAASVWAKTGESAQWMPLYQHMRDSGATAGVLWDQWLPRATRELLDGGVGAALARKRMRFLAIVHDIGKATPPFAMQSKVNFARMNDSGLHAFDSAGKNELWHSTASRILIERFLIERGWNPDAATSWAVVPGSHHGMTPGFDSDDFGSDFRLIGGPVWTQVQDELLRFSFDVAGISDDEVDFFATCPLTKRQQMIATAVVVLSDWLASDPDRFPLDGHSPERTRAAVSSINLPHHWSAEVSASSAAEFYQYRFGTGGRPFDPRPSQLAALEVARGVQKPGLLIVEAPMGEGKTEIGLAVAETFAARTGAGGVFFALPTMSTADAIFSQRFTGWVRDLADEAGQKQSVHVSHSRANINDDFALIPRQGKLSQISEDGGDPLVVHDWLSGGKKGALASFVVGTIDQVLVAGLRSRHVMLRHLALMNKVVVIDEVHAADAYMAVYLDRVLEWLGEYGIPVILLSATLPASRRAALLRAYSPSSDTTAAESATGYPIITATDGSRIVIQAAARSGRASTPEIEFIDDVAHLIVSMIRESTTCGGVTAVIRNTVSNAQETAELFRTELPDHEIILAHSRFVAQDRGLIEKDLRDRFGPDSVDRPYKAVIVGTQVLEQSLDVDFDLMFTDHAPTDLVLQRLGRLHRHVRTDRPARVSTPKCVIIGAPELDDVDAGLKSSSSRSIYGEYLLARSAQVLRGTGNTINIPDDIPTLVNATYDSSLVTADLADYLSGWLQEVKTSRAKAGAWLLGKPSSGLDMVGMLQRTAGDADDESSDGFAAVRDIEDSLEVVVAQRGEDGILRTLNHLPGIDAGRVLSETTEPSERAAKVLATSLLRLPAYISRHKIAQHLEGQRPAAWGKSKWLKRALPLVLDTAMTAHIPGANIVYSATNGLTVVFDEKE